MKKSVSTRPRLTVNRQRFDAMCTFQMKSIEKRAILSLIDGRRFKVQGDVLREMMYEYFANHDIDPVQFEDELLDP